MTTDFRASAKLAQEVAQLRKENRRLRTLTKNGRWGRILYKAQDDALAMLAWRFSGFNISRSYCIEQGMTEVRWSWARALMMVARIHDGRDISVDDIDTARRKVNATVKRIADSDDDHLDSLRLRMPKRFRWGNWRDYQ